jgi:hypothetical protein
MGILEHIAIPKAQYLNLIGIQGAGSLLVVFSLSGIGMLTTIEFHDQATCDAIEVDDVTLYGCLPSESVTAEPTVPEQ